MTTIYTLPEDLPKIDSAIKELLHGRWGWRSRGAVFGLCGGFSAPIIGGIVTVISWFTDPAWHGISLHQAGTSFFVVTLPLLILGAHCLDLLDKDKGKLNEVEEEVRR